VVRKIKYKHNKISILPQDNTKEISRDEWNDGHNELGMTGHGSATTLTISSGSITPINDMHIIDGEGAADDDLDTIDNTETAEFDEIWLYAGAQEITVKNGTGNIFTLSGLDIILNSNVPIKLIRKGTDWHEVGSNVEAESFFGDGSDGDVIISSNTDLGAANFKQFNNLTINAGIELTGNSGTVIKVKGTLTLLSATSKITVTGKGTSGGLGGGDTNQGGDGGNGGGTLFVYAKEIIAASGGVIESNGDNGDNGVSGGTGSSDGFDGIEGVSETILQSNSEGKGGDVNIGDGGGGGASIGDGGNGSGGEGEGGTKFTNKPSGSPFSSGNMKGAGGGGGGRENLNNAAGGGGGGGGGFVFILTISTVPSITISVDGGDGGDENTGVAAGGGGGGGGYAILSHTQVSTATISADGGDGGSSGGVNGQIGIVLSSRR